MFDVIIEARKFHFAEELLLIAKIIIKILIDEYIYVSQPFNSIFKMGSVHCSIGRFYVWLLLYELFYFEWLDLTHVRLIFHDSELYYYSAIFKYHKSFYHHDKFICYLALVISLKIFYKI